MSLGTALFKLVWGRRFGDVRIVRATGWRTAIYDGRGGQRIHGTICLFPWDCPEGGRTVRLKYTDTILMVGCWMLAMLLVGCIHVHLIGGRSQTINIYRSDDNMTDTAMEAPSDTDLQDVANPEFPIDKIQFGPGTLSGGGGGTTPPSPGGDTPSPDPTPPDPAPDTSDPVDLPDEPAPTAADSVFLWKPESESDGNLAILLPWCIHAASVSAHNPHGEWVHGTLSGLSNTIRETWRFGYPGGGWSNPNVPVRVITLDGEELTWTVPAGGQRYDQDYDCGD